MTRLSSLLVACAIVAGVAPASNAQSMPGAAAKAAAHKAADAASAHVEAEQRPDGPSRPTAVVSTVSNGDVRRDTVKSSGKKPGLVVGTKSDTTAVPTTIMREEYAYSRDGRRDPFYSLLATSELRPTIGDLRLTGILFDRAGNRSVATLRDVSVERSVPGVRRFHPRPHARQRDSHEGRDFHDR